MREVANRQDSTSWQLPHKIFLWDPNGVYIDCGFPNPRYGHFLTHHCTLKGARVMDVFSRAVSRCLQTTIQTAWKTNKDQKVRLMFQRGAQHYEATVVCVSTQEEQIIGFVTDRPVGAQRVGMDLSRSVPFYAASFAPHSRQACAKNGLSSLTSQEHKVLSFMGFDHSKGGELESSGDEDVIEGCFTPGLTNKDIAERMQLFVRTVKFHLTNIYRKLQITSRHQLLPPVGH